MSEEANIVGYRITVPTGEYSRDTDIYCPKDARPMRGHWGEDPIFAHTARQYHLSCCICHVPLLEQYYLDILGRYDKLLIWALDLLEDNPLGTAHDLRRYWEWRVEEKHWKEQTRALLSPSTHLTE